MIELTIWQFFGVAFSGAILGAAIWHWIGIAKTYYDIRRYRQLLDEIREEVENGQDGE